MLKSFAELSLAPAMCIALLWMPAATAQAAGAGDVAPMGADLAAPGADSAAEGGDGEKATEKAEREADKAKKKAEREAERARKKAERAARRAKKDGVTSEGEQLTPEELLEQNKQALDLVGNGLSEPTERNKAGLDLWSDPNFARQFDEQFKRRAEVEPDVSETERETLRTVLGLMQDNDETGEQANPAAAAEQLEAAIDADPAGTSALLDFTLGSIYVQLDKQEEALDCYESALAKFPSFMRAHRTVGLVYVQNNRFKEAVGHLSRVIELGGGDGLTYGLLGYGYQSEGQHISAESAFRQALLFQPGTLDWKQGLAQALLKQNKWEEAIALSNELVSQYPDAEKFWLLQANAFIGNEQPLMAAQNFEILRRMGKATPESLMTLGDIYVNQSMWDLATNAYLASIELDSKQPVAAPVQRVNWLQQRGAMDQAKELLYRIKDVYAGRLEEEQHKDLLKVEARIAVAEGVGGEMISVLEEIVALDPLDAETLMLLGRHYATGEPEKAMFYYERAENIDGYEADAKVRRAQLLVGQSEYCKARDLLNRAQQVKPREDVGKYLEQVERAAKARGCGA
ncbi:hypothetical protein ABI59_17455 [Acidobacteria bacterium Mor1]|nr:hypothetical protein ABI59_17455 [Acidobacteria bacterium Mor1]